MIDGIPNLPLYFDQKDIVDLRRFLISVPSPLLTGFCHPRPYWLLYCCFLFLVIRWNGIIHIQPNLYSVTQQQCLACHARFFAAEIWFWFVQSFLSRVLGPYHNVTITGGLLKSERLMLNIPIIFYLVAGCWHTYVSGCNSHNYTGFNPALCPLFQSYFWFSP